MADMGNMGMATSNWKNTILCLCCILYTIPKCILHGVELILCYSFTYLHILSDFGVDLRNTGVDFGDYCIHISYLINEHIIHICGSDCNILLPL
jgi:hypothetical protein